MDICAELSSLTTPCVSDASGGLDNLDSAIVPLRENDRVCGQALTVRLALNDNKAVLQALREARPGQVLVVDAKACLHAPIAGDFVVGMAKVLGLAGIVADGVIRDVQGVKETGLPVFCRGTTIARAGKGGQGEVNVPISCGGVPVMPGDWILGDADGVTVVPQGRAECIIADAKGKQRCDEERTARVLASREDVLRHLDSVLG
jgi:Demethylmenaquinone methyltransferase